MTYTKKTEKYFENIEKKVREVYVVAEDARSKGFDPVDKVEVSLAMTMAEKCVGLISVIYPQMIDSGIDKRILELEEQYGKLNPTVIFKIGEEVAKQNFCKFENQLQAIDAGIRIGFAYATIGVVSPPIEGFTELKLGKTKDGKEYFVAYFSGPIRAAGTTASCMVLFLIDFLRETFGYAKYDSNEEEVSRYVTENNDYHERVSNLQYFPLEEEIVFLAQHLPIQIAGDPTEKLEVSNYKNLERVDTNFIRGGMCLIFSEGLAQKAKKGFRLLGMAKENGIKCTGFDWIPKYLDLHDKLTSSEGKSRGDGVPVYIKDLVAGRPVFGHPSMSGSFRFRYGRSRVDGFSAVSVHPATMAITDNFIAIGTQLKIEKPTKGCAVASCDSIEGPIVKLFNGSVVQVKTKEEGKKLYKDVEEIIYLGDILFSFGDVLNRGANLIKPGYVEEWWELDLRKKVSEFGIRNSDVGEEIRNQNSDVGSEEIRYQKSEGGEDVRNQMSEIGKEEIRNQKSDVRNRKGRNQKSEISLDEAIELSKKYKIPFYPKYIFYWKEITKELFLGLIEWLKNSRIDEKLILPYNKEDKKKFKLGKRALELLGVSHEVVNENVILTKEMSKALFVNLGIEFRCQMSDVRCQKLEDLDWEKYKVDSAPQAFPDKSFSTLKSVPREKKDFSTKGKISTGSDVLDIINKFSKFEIKDKSGEFIGARMGRPEKAKLRKLQGSPNILFPVGREGGRLRSVQAACEVGKVKSNFPIYFCEDCKYETIYPSCEKCGKKNKQMYYFYESKEKGFEKKIVQGITSPVSSNERSEKEGTNHCLKSIEINDYFQDAVKKLGMEKDEIPLLIKGIRGMSSDSKKVEHLAKGILRAKYDLQVNKDGTIRFDATELPIVSFKPLEISVSIEKLKELGYEKDINGDDLTKDDQILEIMPHDVLFPCAPNSPDENADDVFVRICNFIDELLVRFYKLKPFYNIKTRDDLIGKIGVFMAPHNCAGVVCRFIGFSKVQTVLASPYMHAAVRRDCDGDEAAIMLLADVLINFSKEFLPSHRGGTQDAPLVLNAKINAGEVDDQILDFECVNEYPLELYEKAEKNEHSSQVKINTVKNILERDGDPFVGIGFTHDTSDFNEGVDCSSYKLLATMKDKVRHQMELVEKIRAADTIDTARLIIDRHFIRDMRGNLRKFSMQGFRCVACNEIMRRPPLSGVCTNCGGKLIFTIHEGGIKKYLEPALDLAKKYNLSPYMKQNLELIKRYIESIFGKEERQEKLE